MIVSSERKHMCTVKPQGQFISTHPYKSKFLFSPLTSFGNKENYRCVQHARFSYRFAFSICFWLNVIKLHNFTFTSTCSSIHLEPDHFNILKSFWIASFEKIYIFLLCHLIDAINKVGKKQSTGEAIRERLAGWMHFRPQYKDWILNFTLRFHLNYWERA